MNHIHEQIKIKNKIPPPNLIIQNMFMAFEKHVFFLKGEHQRKQYFVVISNTYTEYFINGILQHCKHNCKTNCPCVN